MRNLKRVLSLALALVMTLSLMVVSSSAKEATRIDFTDADEIAYKEAVDVMVALGVIDGGDQGAFEPDGILTREQAAKVICYMLLGPDNAENLTTNTQIFTDVAAGRWSAGYISYCANLDILAGTGEGTFLPAGELTGVTFGKMLLVALGYRADIEGYVGSNWATAIASDMVDAGIAVNGVVMTEPLTREQAAQMAFQTLEATMVKYDTEPVIVNMADGTSVIVSAPTANPVPSTGLNYNGAADGTQSESYMQFCEKYFDKLTKYDDFDDFGRPGGIWKYNNAEICFSVDEAVGTFTGTFSRKDLYNVLGNGVVNNLALTPDANKYTVNCIVNGQEGQAGVWDNRTTISGVPHPVDFDYALIEAGPTNNLAADRAETGAVLGANGLLTEAYLVDVDGDGKEDEVRIIMTQTFLAQADGDYDADKGELEFTVLSDTAPGLPTKISSDDVAGLDVFREDDYILITASTADGVTYTVQTATAPEIVNGEVSAYTKIGTLSVTVGGTKYLYSMCKEDANTTDREYSVDDIEYSLVLDPYGYVMTTEGANGASNYVFIREFGSEGGLTINTQKVADAIFTDGTRETISLKNVYQSDGSTDLTTTPGPGPIGWFTYSVKDGQYTLTQMRTTTDSTHKTAATTAGTAASTSITTNGETATVGTKTGTNSTVYLVLNKKTVTVYTGYKNVPTITTGTGDVAYSVVFSDKGYAQYVFVDVGTNGSVVGGETSDLVFILDTSTKYVDGNGTFYIYPAILNGSVVDLKTTTEGLKVGLYKDPTWDGDAVDGQEWVRGNGGDYTVQDATSSVGVITQDGYVLTIAGTVYKLADTCDIKTIDGKTVTNVTAARLANLYKSSGDLDAVIYGVKDSDGYYTSIYVEIGGTMPTPSSDKELKTVTVTLDKLASDTSARGIADLVGTVDETSHQIDVTFGAITGTLANGDKLVVTADTVSDGATVTTDSFELTWSGSAWTSDPDHKTIVVEAENETTQTYTFNSVKSTDASLTAAYGTYTEDGGGSVTASGSATVTVEIDSEDKTVGTITIITSGITNAENDDSFTVTLTKGYSGATMTDGGTPTPGSVSGLTITYDSSGSSWSSNKDTVVVTAEDGSTVVTYTVSVDPAP